MAIAMLLPMLAHAQARECRIPAVLPRPQIERPSSPEPQRSRPVTGYTLALSWSPEYCRMRTRSPRDSIQCGGAADHFGFTLHGLWPEGRGRQWPQYCRAVPLLPEPLLRAHLCTTPSVQLLQHEWAKHGSCMPNAGPDRYLRLATAMYRAVRYPDMDRLPRRRDLTVGQFARSFAAANPGVMPSMLRVRANERGWLEELWICLDARLKPAHCPAHQTGAPDAARLRIEDGR